MDSRPSYPFTPSHHGEPCPYEGDETARYATLLDDLLMVGVGVLGCISLAGFIYFAWWA